MRSKQLRKKHVPLRTCVVCREKEDKRQLIRIVRGSETGIMVDPTGKQNGRGAYLCGKNTCWQQALYSKVLDKALKTELSEEQRQAIAEFQPVEDSFS